MTTATTLGTETWKGNIFCRNEYNEVAIHENGLGVTVQPLLCFILTSRTQESGAKSRQCAGFHH